MLGDVAAGIMFTMASPGFFTRVTCVHCELALIYKENGAVVVDLSVMLPSGSLFLAASVQRRARYSPALLIFPSHFWDCAERPSKPGAGLSVRPEWAWILPALMRTLAKSKLEKNGSGEMRREQWFSWSYRFCIILWWQGFLFCFFYKQCITISLLQSIFPCFYFEQQTVMPF